MSEAPDRDNMLWKEQIANRPKHWVRAVTACNSRCMFCLDMDTPRNVYLDEDEVKEDLRKGRETLDAWKVILSGGEATLHPKFPEFVRYAHEIGYGRVQTVTNGYRFGNDGGFLKECVDAGLNEITFSLHGHTEELHDHLTQHKGSFRNIVKGIMRAKRDGRLIVNIDVVINKQNVPHLDKIIDLGARLGVFEYDLLHVIPQAEAFRRRDELFYNPRQYLPMLRKVFRLNRHPRFVIWTNRFPITFLEGMEDLIQDPHKMLDEVNGRRYHVRAYLDRGVPLNCREQERCVHCFIEPFCTTMDRTVRDQNKKRFEVWSIGDDRDPGELPYGTTRVGVTTTSLAELPDLGHPVYVESDAADDPSVLPPGSVLVAKTADQLDAWLDSGFEIEVHLNRETAPWMLANPARIEAALANLVVHQPTWEHMSEAMDHDVRDPSAFFRELGLRIRVCGLPACQVPNTTIVPRRKILRRDAFDDNGRLVIRELARDHVRDGYYAKSSRCEDCRLTSRCDGMHVNMIRDQGLSLLTPLTAGDWTDDAEQQLHALHPEPIDRISTGKRPERTAESLPGFGPAPEPERDPLAIKEEQRQARRAEIRAKAKKQWAAEQAKQAAAESK